MRPKSPIKYLVYELMMPLTCLQGIEILLNDIQLILNNFLLAVFK